MNLKKVKLAKSLRKNIRKKKEKIRKKYGPASTKEKELADKIKTLKEKKLSRHR